MTRVGKVIRAVTKEDSPVQAIMWSFIRSGPWAIMALAIVLGVGWEMHNLSRTAGKTVSDYVIQSSKNNELLVKSTEKREREHTSMAHSMDLLQLSSSRVNDAVVVNENKLKQIEALLQETKSMMSAVPAQREEHLQILKRIEAGIRELNDNYQKILNGREGNE